MNECSVGFLLYYFLIIVDVLDVCKDWWLYRPVDWRTWLCVSPPHSALHKTTACPDDLGAFDTSVLAKLSSNINHATGMSNSD